VTLHASYVLAAADNRDEIDRDFRELVDMFRGVSIEPASSAVIGQRIVEAQKK
jgi:hypothetical protein